MIVMKRGDLQIWGLGVAVVFGLLWFVDFLFALAGVSFLLEWFTVEQLSSESARASAITAAVGLIGGVGALITFLFNYQQKQQQFENSQDLSRKQHEYEMIFREYSELSRDFASDHELSRINAAINLVRIAKLPDPRFDEKHSRREGDRNWILEKYPWFKSTCMQLATACLTYSGSVQKNAILRAVKEMSEFAGMNFVGEQGEAQLESNNGKNFQPLIEFMLTVMGESNSIVFDKIKNHIKSGDWSNSEFSKIVQNTFAKIGCNFDGVSWVEYLGDFELNENVLEVRKSNAKSIDIQLFNLFNMLQFCNMLFFEVTKHHKRITIHDDSSNWIEISNVCFVNITFVFTNISCIHFTECDFSGFCMRKCGAKDCKFTTCRFCDTYVTHSDLSSSIFRDSEFLDISFYYSNLESTEYSKTRIKKLELTYSSIRNANICHAKGVFDDRLQSFECSWGKMDFTWKEKFVLPTFGRMDSYKNPVHKELIEFLWINFPYSEMKKDLTENLPIELSDNIINSLADPKKELQEHFPDSEDKYSLTDSYWTSY